MLKGSVAVSWKMATLDLAAAVLGSWCATPPLQQIAKSVCETEKKRKEKNMLKGVNLVRSQVLYRAAQVSLPVYMPKPLDVLAV